jgi:hypothetical protein
MRKRAYLVKGYCWGYDFAKGTQTNKSWLYFGLFEENKVIFITIRDDSWTRGYGYPWFRARWIWIRVEKLTCGSYRVEYPKYIGSGMGKILYPRVFSWYPRYQYTSLNVLHPLKIKAHKRMEQKNTSTLACCMLVATCCYFTMDIGTTTGCWWWR